MPKRYKLLYSFVALYWRVHTCVTYFAFGVQAYEKKMERLMKHRAKKEKTNQESVDLRRYPYLCSLATPAGIDPNGWKPVTRIAW